MKTSWSPAINKLFPGLYAARRLNWSTAPQGSNCGWPHLIRPKGEGATALAVDDSNNVIVAGGRRVVKSDRGWKFTVGVSRRRYRAFS